jgi:hypothetical protein
LSQALERLLYLRDAPAIGAETLATAGGLKVREKVVSQLSWRGGRAFGDQQRRSPPRSYPDRDSANATSSMLFTTRLNRSRNSRIAVGSPRRGPRCRNRAGDNR